MNSSAFINPHLIRTFIKPLFAIIALLLVIAPAAQDSEYPAPENLRFTDNSESFAWDKPAGEIRTFTVRCRHPRNFLLAILPMDPSRKGRVFQPNLIR